MKRLFALAAMLPTAVLAQESDSVSYSYFDFNYLGTSWDNATTNLDGNGYSGRFSIAIRDHMFIFGSYEAWEFDDVDGGSTAKSIGIGSDWALGDKFSFYGALGLADLDLDAGTGNVEDNAALLTGGIRWAIGNGFELRAAGEYAELSDTGTGDTSIVIGGDIFLTDVVALTIEWVENEEDTSTYLLGVRFYPSRDSFSYRRRR